MNPLNNTQIKPLVILHTTKKFWVITSALVLWTLLTSIITYGLVVQSYAIPVHQESCGLSSPIQYQPSDQKLIKKVTEVYKLPQDKAANIVNLAVTHTIPGVFPSPELMVALFKVESDFRENVTSFKGARGMAQVMPMNSTGTGSFNNVYDSVVLLREYHTRLNGNLTKTLQAYNAGIGKLLSGKAKNIEYAQEVKRELNKLKSS